MSGNATYGFVLYYDLHCAVTAKKFMDGKVINGNKIRVSINNLLLCILKNTLPLCIQYCTCAWKVIATYML